jgi:hypothetical protein
LHQSPELATNVVYDITQLYAAIYLIVLLNERTNPLTRTLSVTTLTTDQTHFTTQELFYTR